jgi:SAM-dependent methyltransferase
VTQLHDQAVGEDVRSILGRHPTLAGVSLTVDVRGAVVHLVGSVRSPEERRLARSVAGRVRGVEAVWDRLEVPDRSSDRVLDIGCGDTRQVSTAFGLDRHPQPGVHVVADLERDLPFTDESFDRVFAVHVLEHVRDLVRLMNEIHRILGPGGILHALSPHRDFVNAYADPTHVRFFDVMTFKYFCASRPGLRVFRPLSVGRTADNVLADLEPVKGGETAAGSLELARHFG